MTKILAVALVSATLLTQAERRPAMPVAAVTAIGDALRTHDVVFIGDGRQHGDQQFAEFAIGLIRNPRINAVVDDIVLECCNARYQGVSDAFVNGQNIPEAELARAAQDAVVQNVGRGLEWSGSVLRAVRDVNAARRTPRRLRVLFADPPIDWAVIHSAAEQRAWVEQRDTFPAELIQREVVAKKRHALVIYGGMHLQRRNLAANYETDGLAATLVSAFERGSGTRAFTIWTNEGIEKFQADMLGWPAASVALLRGTALGAIDFSTFVGGNTPRIAIRDGKPDFAAGPIPRDQWRTLAIEEQFDALLYLGPISTMTVSAPTGNVCADPYTAILRQRLALIQVRPELDRLERICGPAKQDVAP